MNSNHLKKLLAQKHSNDLYVEECKNGPTILSGPLGMIKLDAWVMKRSWSNPHTIGYEIKISRADFLIDDKWNRYLDLCSHFYFVAPQGIIHEDELPKEVGLIVASKTGTKLFTKKKAPCRKVDIPESLFRYILMCRATVCKDTSSFSKQEFWDDWLKRKLINNELGRECSKQLRVMIEEKIESVKHQNESLSRENENLKDVKAICKELGISIHGYHSKSIIEQKIEDKNSVIPKDVKRAIRELSRWIKAAEKAIEE